MLGVTETQKCYDIFAEVSTRSDLHMFYHSLFPVTLRSSPLIADYNLVLF